MYLWTLTRASELRRVHAGAKASQKKDARKANAMSEGRNAGSKRKGATQLQRRRRWCQLVCARHRKSEKEEEHKGAPRGNEQKDIYRRVRG